MKIVVRKKGNILSRAALDYARHRLDQEFNRMERNRAVLSMAIAVTVILVCKKVIPN